MLGQVLYQVDAFLDQKTALSDTKLASLKSARECCRTALEEVDEFLDKHANVNTKKRRKRYLQIARFITHDADGLKRKLHAITDLLHISLTSLSSSRYAQLIV